MNAVTTAAVRARAADRCEYCRLPQSATPVRHVVDHVIARQHGGGDAAENLALACQRCNLHKGPNIAGIDPAGGDVVALFHPRRDRWADHFATDRERIEPRTARGRTTVAVLKLNDESRLAVRRELLAEGVWP